MSNVATKVASEEWNLCILDDEKKETNSWRKITLSRKRYNKRVQ